MSIHRIVDDALRQMEQYEIPRTKEKYEMVYCLGRIEANKGYREAMLVLNEHLDKHYVVAKPRSMCDLKSYEEKLKND